jgi:hypothetical protein
VSKAERVTVAIVVCIAALLCFWIIERAGGFGS